MFSLVDTHCHLCAGLDDGPASLDEALEMCRMAYDDGVRWVAAVAHQNERHPDVTPERIKQSIRRLDEALQAAGVPLALRPAGEVMVQLEMIEQLEAQQLLTVGGQGAYLLLEYPTGLFVDIRFILEELARRGVRPILAHPERHPELLHDAGRVEQLIELGALIQISASSVTGELTGRDVRAIKRWVRRGVVHLIGSDGHSPGRRPPLLGGAYRRIAQWAGQAAADRICGIHGLAVLQGRPLNPPPPEPPKRRWWMLR